MTAAVAPVAPLTPANCDLQDFAFMPLDVARLRDSELAVDASPDECWAALRLRCASWHEVPAASIPNDDAWCAKASGMGRRWRRVKVMALRGWIACADGRLYHPVVAARALKAWDRKQVNARRLVRRLEIESGEWAALRAAVFKRDGYTCQYCGAHGVRLEADHVVAVANGGASTMDNLTTACLPCNRAKGTKSLAAWRACA